MSSLNERDALRRALLEAVEGIEPGADGLHRIRARLSPPRPVAVAWADAASTFVRRRGPSALQESLEWVRGVISEVWDRFGPQRGPSGARTSRAALGWLRPAIALGVMVFIVAAGVYGAISAQQGISSSTSANSPHSNGAAAGGGGASHGGGGGLNTQSQSTIGAGGSTGGKAKPTCKPRRSGSSRPSANLTSPSASAGASSASVSPTPTVDVSSAPTPGVSATGLVSPSTAGGSASAAAAQPTAGSHGAQAPSSLATSGTSRCVVRHHRATSTAPKPTPSAAPAAASYAKLDDAI